MENTKIEWADHTWNPWQGCHKISPACLNCYMFRDKKRWCQNPDEVVRSSRVTFEKPLSMGGPARVFVCSWSDFFIKEADAWRHDAWEIIRAKPDLTFMLLTKRPERIGECLPEDWGNGYENVWLGITAENQKFFDLRASVLIQIPSLVRFVSVEPMLGPIRLPFWAWSYFDWIICGCESGPEARETKMAWVRNLRDQCEHFRIKFFLKQLREGKGLRKMPHLDGRQWGEIPYI